MIESNIINWIDLGDAMQNLDVYSKKKIVKFFNLIRVLLSYKSFSIFFYAILQFFFFLQIMFITIINIDKKDDHIISVLRYIRKIIFLQYIVKNSSRYKIAVIAISVLTLIIIICLIYVIISIKIGRFYMKIPIFFLNLIFVILIFYLIGPIVQVCLMCIDCSDNIHEYLKVKCFSDSSHLFYSILSFFNLLFYVVLTLILGIYYNEIGCINENKMTSRVNCNYEIYMSISKIIMFVLGYIIEFLTKNKKIYRVILEGYVFLNSCIFSVYVYKDVLFFDSKMNYANQFGWVYVAWFSFVIIMKTLLKITDTTIFHIVGWIILGFTIYFLYNYRQEFLITDCNIFESKSLKEIELYNKTLLTLMNQRSVKSKTILVGIIKKFEDMIKNSPELYEKYSKLCNNEHLKKKFNNNSALQILSIIYIIYDHHLEKSYLKNDIVLNMCYFLMNKLKNPTFSISLCSKLKVSSHKHLYLKYILMEEIKEYLVNKLSKSNNKESIKHVQIGSVILYNIYIDLFKIKIYDAACNQIDYFDILKNNVSTPKTTENFLKIGEDILKLRKEILKLWEKIVELNPFSDESEKDYMLYLETILQDEVLARTESKKYSTLKTNKLSERNNIYHSMFIQELSSILLIDGFSSNGKILYTTPNFPTLFAFSGKEILNMTVDDLLPNVIHTFHKDLIDDAIKFTNVNYKFKTQRDMLLKGKNGGIFNVKLFVKCVPNLSYGLIYTAFITKILDHNFILILDKDFKINGFTEMTSSGTSFTMNNNYGLTQGLYGHHIAIIIPEILLQMEFKEGKFTIPKSDIDLKGNLYPVSAWKELDSKVESVLDKIKQNGNINIDDEEKNTVQEYDDLLKDINQKYQKPFSVFYKIVTKTFLDEKYCYHRIYITNDLIGLNENSKSFPTQVISSGKQDLKKTELKLSTFPENNNINDAEENSGKQIKLKIASDENKNVLDEKKDEKKDDENQNEKENQNNNNQNNNNNNNLNNNEFISKPSSGPSSVLTKSSIDSAGFNKLKNGILEKKEISNIKVMKYLCFVFGLFTIGFIIINNLRVKKNFEDLCEYLSQNLYFNHSKISVSCVYLSTLNLKWVKDNFTSESNCEIYEDCSSFYSYLLSTCILDIKTEKENASYFYEDFKNILGQTKEIHLILFNLSTTDDLTIDVDNLLNLLISNGLKLNANLETYYARNARSYNIYDANSQNILIQGLDYVNNQNIEGFGEKTKKDKINKKFGMIPIELICVLIIFIILTLIYGFLIFKLNDMEKFFLERLISFKSQNFENYLKRLEELKKKLRNDNGDEDEKANGELDMGELGSKKGSKKDDDEEGKDKKKKKEEKDEKDNKKKLKKRNGAKQNKIQQQRNKKKKIMAKFFFKWNLLFTLKVLCVLLISVTYYLVIMLIQSNKKKDYLTFDTTTNSIEGLYRDSFDIFLLFKTELATYENLAANKNNALQNITNGINATITLSNGTNVTCSNNQCVNSLKYTMNIPTSSEIITPKLGNLLMPLVNDLSGNSANTLNNLYNSDACAVLFDSNSSNYTTCSEFWSSILVKGMEQSITQMSVVINTVIDELNSLNEGTKEFSDIIEKGSSFANYEVFVEYYLFLAYMKTVDVFDDFRDDKLKNTKKTFNTILICYIVGAILLFFVLLYFVYSSKSVFNSFLNFIGILPVKYLTEDDSLFKDILKLEQSIF